MSSCSRWRSRTRDGKIANLEPLSIDGHLPWAFEDDMAVRRTEDCWSARAIGSGESQRLIAIAAEVDRLGHRQVTSSAAETEGPVFEDPDRVAAITIEVGCKYVTGMHSH